MTEKEAEQIIIDTYMNLLYSQMLTLPSNYTEAVKVLGTQKVNKIFSEVFNSIKNIPKDYQ
jgi:hypothetical protein